MDWMERALCKGKNQDLWYPPLDQPNQSDYYQVGRAICEQCPVWDQCLTMGMEERWGMFGGLTPSDRKAIQSGKENLLRPHGTIARFRQGCNCIDCEDVAYAEPIPVSLTKIPGKLDRCEIEKVLEILQN